jgi:hypothetical protein
MHNIKRRILQDIQQLGFVSLKKYISLDYKIRPEEVDNVIMELIQENCMFPILTVNEIIGYKNPKDIFTGYIITKKGRDYLTNVS